MRKKEFPLFLIIMAVVLSGCHDSMVEINTDPNNPTQVPTSNLLSNAQRQLTGEILGINEDDGHARWSSEYMQYWSNTLYTSTTRYETVEADWNEFYDGGLSDLEEIIRINIDPEEKLEAQKYGSNNNQIAVAEILQVWGFHNVTDIWGEVPFSEALQGRKNFSPKYDPQEAIYDSLIAQLDRATARIDESERPPQGDLILDGDMNGWRLFANSLKLRLGMRLSERSPEKAKRIVQEAVNSGVIGSSDENIYFEYLDSEPNYNPWKYEARVEGGSYNLAVTTTAIGKLQSYDDPRLYVYAAPAKKDGKLRGIPYGVESGVASEFDNVEVSFQTDDVYNSPGRIMTYSEVLLLQAEAAERGWISGNPKALYEKGIRANMKEWSVPDSTDIDAYLEQDIVKYDSDSFKKKIGNQLWFALYTQPLETWANWRRLGYPELEPAPDAFRGRDIPRRRGYPQAESELNRENYEAAVERQGPDELSTRVWWDAE
jgi:hypothetical protein